MTLEFDFGPQIERALAEAPVLEFYPEANLDTLTRDEISRKYQPYSEIPGTESLSNSDYVSGTEVITDDPHAYFALVFQAIQRLCSTWSRSEILSTAAEITSHETAHSAAMLMINKPVEIGYGISFFGNPPNVAYRPFTRVAWLETPPTKEEMELILTAPDDLSSSDKLALQSMGLLDQSIRKAS